MPSVVAILQKKNLITPPSWLPSNVIYETKNIDKHEKNYDICKKLCLLCDNTSESTICITAEDLDWITDMIDFQ